MEPPGDQNGTRLPPVLHREHYTTWTLDKRPWAPYRGKAAEKGEKTGGRKREWVEKGAGVWAHFEFVGRDVKIIPPYVELLKFRLDKLEFLCYIFSRLRSQNNTRG